MAHNHVLLLSIRPRFAESIFAGTKTVELRRVRPRLTKGDLVVVYASGSTKGIIGAFEVSGVTAASPCEIWRVHGGESGLTKVEFESYFAGTNLGYALHVGRLWKLEDPVLLGALRKQRLGFRPPQSYHYLKLDEVAEMGGDALSSHLAERNHDVAKSCKSRKRRKRA